MSRYSLGDISDRADSWFHARPCEHCGALRPQQLIERYQGGHRNGELWAVLACKECPQVIRVKEAS